LRDTPQQSKRGPAVTTLIEEVDCVLTATREHKKSPEQRVGSRGVLGQAQRTVAQGRGDAPRQKLVESDWMHGTSKTLNKVEKGHVKPPGGGDTCEAGKIRGDRSRVIRTFQVLQAYSSCQCS